MEASRRSSTEDDYREIFDAAIHDRLRDHLDNNAHKRKVAQTGSKMNIATHEDADLTRIATNLTRDFGITPQTLGDIDPRLSPQNDAFDFRFWATTFLKLIREDGIKQTKIGFSFEHLSVSGTTVDFDIQPTLLSPFAAFSSLFRTKKGNNPPKRILNNLNGAVNNGEMLLVLGRPGSGCSTFLKSISGHDSGFIRSQESKVTYDGIPQDILLKSFKGRAVYNQENDENFPYLTVAQTLQFAAEAQTPQTRIQGVSRKLHSHHMAEVVMRIFGLSHVRNTIVGDDVIRGVSGGERKRVSLAEMALARSSIAAWDNSTRGLDAATAFEFIRSLQTFADLAGITQAVAIYQISPSVFDLFDKVLVLYEGRQIYFGPCKAAAGYFEKMGWQRPPRQTIPDFLTSVTNPSERMPRPGFEHILPKSACDFEILWQSSEEFKHCVDEVARSQMGVDHTAQMEELRLVHRQLQAKHSRKSSPYLLSGWMQLILCMKRAQQLLWNDRGSTITLAIGRVILALVIGSIYYGPPSTTASLSAKGSVLFLATLLNALMAVTEIGTLFSKRATIEKQKNYAFYHPFAEALATFFVDIPPKFIISTLFNVVFYFIAGLRATASNFFIFMLFSFFCMLTMSAIFRAIGAMSKELPGAYAIAGIAVLIMMIYTGFTLPTTYMHPWFRWINYINPIAYVFESLIVNEVHGVQYPCSTENIVPPYFVSKSNVACAFLGAIPGELSVSGDEYVQAGYGYSYSHMWRNFGITILYLVVFLGLYLVASEFRSKPIAKPQQLIFRTREQAKLNSQNDNDIEAKLPELRLPLSTKASIPIISTVSNLERDSSCKESDTAAQSQSTYGWTLSWENLCLAINQQGTPRSLLHNVTGWIEPGKMTCLMGTSGAGKTTLLDTLAQRNTKVGQLSGTVKVNGLPLQSSFQRRTGYVQQQDLHLGTSTVREALRFSASLRQPSIVTPEEKYSYVEEVIQMLGMESFSDAIVGQPGEGLNLEQRKLLTIAVELAAKPKILFLDEPTSGLDSQSSWTIITLLRKLAKEGQTILATIHQPSAMLFQQFDSILLLAKGGRTLYFGPLGRDCKTITRYFESAGARHCSPDENPAEYILSTAQDGSHNWQAIWESSQEYDACRLSVSQIMSKTVESTPGDFNDATEFATSFATQYRLVLTRLFRHYWRSPTYIFAKYQAGISSALFIGFTFFLQDSSTQALQNVVFSIYMLNATFATMVNQIMSVFVPQRSLFEMRESPSRMYSWPVFLLSHIVVEFPYQCILSVLMWACWYFPVFGLHQSSGNDALMLVFCLQFVLFAATWAQMMIFTLPNMMVAGSISTILFTMTLQFNGVLQPPAALPGFWIFMYRISPFTYLIGGWAGTGLEGRNVSCAQNELAIFDPPAGQTCSTYLERYLQAGAPGQLLNSNAQAKCEYCPIRNAEQFLARSWIYPEDKARNVGIVFAYIAFNAMAALILYYCFRVKRLSLSKVFSRKPRSRAPTTKENHTILDGSKKKDSNDGRAVPRWYKTISLYSYLVWRILRNTVR